MFQYLYKRCTTAAGIALCWAQTAVANPIELQTTALPPLFINGIAARAHTQGIEWVGSMLYVTARREDVSPMQPLLLRTTAGGDHWDVWNLTLSTDTDTDTQSMDHPGGLQSDGTHLWIPQSQSRRNSRSRIRVVALNALEPGRPVHPTREFNVDDHIGAVAVAPERNRVFGASWDTETVWVWSLEGTLVEKRSSENLRPMSLGMETGATKRAGLTVQDWKWINGELIASGLWKTPGANTASAPRSRLVAYPRFLETATNQTPRWFQLPNLEGRELSNEGMTIALGRAWFLPEDLGTTNRLFSIPWPTKAMGANPY